MLRESEIEVKGRQVGVASNTSWCYVTLTKGILIYYYLMLSQLILNKYMNPSIWKVLIQKLIFTLVYINLCQRTSGNQ